MRIAIIGLLAGLMLAAIGCGSVTMSMTTEVRDDVEAVNSLSVSATGDIAKIFDNSFKEIRGVWDDKCDPSYSGDQFEVSCSEFTTSELNSGAGLDLQVVKSELSSHTEYRASMTNPFWEAREDIESDSLAEGVDTLRFQWNVDMPGEIVESDTNADSIDGNVAEFDISLDDTRRILTVVSRGQAQAAGVPGIIVNCLGWSLDRCERGGRVVVKYWSVLALAVSVVLTALAIVRSDWRERSTIIVVVMALGCLAILAHVGFIFTYHDGYATTMRALTILSIISFPAVCVLGIVMLRSEPATTVASPPPGSTTLSAPTDVSPPGMTNAPSMEETTLGSPASPVSGPSATIAMQTDAARSMVWLVVTQGPSEGKSIQLREGVNTIGRSLENDLQIDDSSVSRSHAMVIIGDDDFTLVDLGSTGGTRIGEHRISGRRIGNGSVITVGQTRFSVVSVDAFSGAPSSAGATMVGSPTGSSLSLVAQSGPDAGKSFLLSDARSVIGRDPSSQVLLTDPTVSRRHALIQVDADRVTISDLGSRSGTNVDGETITGVRITVGDHIAIGQSEFRLMRPGS